MGPKHLTHQALQSKTRKPGEGDRPAILGPDSTQLPQLGALRAAQPGSRYLDLRIFPVTRNVLSFQSQQTRHTDFTTGEPFQALEACTHTE